MGYYLDIIKPDLGNSGICLGGKFFGYLDDDEFESCESYQFLQSLRIDDIELLNVWYSCFRFDLALADALKFLSLYRRDFHRIEKRNAFGVQATILELKRIKPERVYFEMG